MATLNTAEHFGVDRDIGSITPGRYADIILTSDLTSLPIEMVIASGDVVVQKGRLKIDLPPYPYPALAKDTVKLKKKLTSYDFDVPAPSPQPAQVRVIGVAENDARTQAQTRVLPVDNGVLQIDSRQDVVHLALVERHRGTGKVVNGFANGFGFKVPCAVASTVAHDCHHMVIVGTSKSNMAQAANRLNEIGGGVVVFKNDEEIALIELPIAGLVSNERAEIVAAKAERMVEAFKECGCKLNNAFMQLSLISLAVIPQLRISDKGIVDSANFEIVPLFLD